jgi:predicted metalloprotease with PDZ domain
MYARYGSGGQIAGGYPPSAFEEVVATFGGEVAAEQLRTLVREAADPDIDSALDWYGLILLRAPERQAAEEAGMPVPVDFGTTWRTDTPLLLIEHVLHGSSAAQAGLLPNDELLAVDGHRVTRDNQEAVIQALRPGEVVELTLARHQRLITREVTVQHAIPVKYQIITKLRVNRREESRLESWLGRPLRITR